MNILNVINAIVVSLGVPAIIAACIYVGRKLQILDTLNESSKSMKHNIVIISNFLIRNSSQFNSSELKSMSPITLTDQGMKIIADIGFDTVFAEHKKNFFEFIDLGNPKLKYDVEDLSIKSIYLLADKPYMQSLKVFLYNNPTRNLNDITPTLGVFVRDQYLKEHPEIVQ